MRSCDRQEQLCGISWRFLFIVLPLRHLVRYGLLFRSVLSLHCGREPDRNLLHFYLHRELWYSFHSLWQVTCGRVNILPQSVNLRENWFWCRFQQYCSGQSPITWYQMKWALQSSGEITVISFAVWRIRRELWSDCLCIWYLLYWFIHCWHYYRTSNCLLPISGDGQWEFTSFIIRSWSLWTVYICFCFRRWITYGYCWEFHCCLFWSLDVSR